MLNLQGYFYVFVRNLNDDLTPSDYCSSIDYINSLEVTTMKRTIFLLVTVLALSEAFCACNSAAAAEMPAPDQEQINQIKEDYPMVFCLDTSKGLDIVVWQLATSDYNFALVSHRDGEYDLLDEGLLRYGATGLSVDQLKAVLATYDISKDDLYIVPWQNSLSSYIPPEIEKDKDGYIKSIRDMLGI